MITPEIEPTEMFVFTDPNLCTGCGLCGEHAPNVFKLSDQIGCSVVHLAGVETWYGDLSGRNVSGDDLEQVKYAAAECPGEIIWLDSELANPDLIKYGPREL